MSKEYTGVFLFQVRCEGVTEEWQYFLVDFNSLKVSFSDIAPIQYDVKLTVDDEIMHKIVNKKVNPTKLIENSIIRVEGNKRLAN